MDIQDKHISILLNSKKNLVSELYDISKRKEYGDQGFDCCLDDLYLKDKLINRLECYNFPKSVTSTTTMGTMTTTQTLSNYTTGDYYLVVYTTNETFTYPYTITSTISNLDVLKLLFSAAGYIYTFTTGGTFTFTVNVDCSVLGISLQTLNASVIDFTSLVAPVCKTEIKTDHNCVEDADLTKMYEVLKSF